MRAHMSSIARICPRVTRVPVVVPTGYPVGSRGTRLPPLLLSPVLLPPSLPRYLRPAPSRTVGRRVPALPPSPPLFFAAPPPVLFADRIFKSLINLGNDPGATYRVYRCIYTFKATPESELTSEFVRGTRVSSGHCRSGTHARASTRWNQSAALYSVKKNFSRH